MGPHFYDLFKNHNKDELFKIVLSPDDYQPEAIIAAIKVIIEKNWKAELDQRLEHEHQLKEQDIMKKAEYFKNAIEFKSQRYSIRVNVSYIPQFESALNDHGIEFFREDQNVLAQLRGHGPEYFFKLENKEIVDELVKELHLYVISSSNQKSFLEFVLKLILIVLAVSFLLYLLYNGIRFAFQ